MHLSPPGSSVCGISQAGILKWDAIFFSRRSSPPGNKLESPAWQMESLPPSHLGSPPIVTDYFQKLCQFRIYWQYQFLLLHILSTSSPTVNFITNFFVKLISMKLYPIMSHYLFIKKIFKVAERLMNRT